MDGTVLVTIPGHLVNLLEMMACLDADEEIAGADTAHRALQEASDLWTDVSITLDQAAVTYLAGLAQQVADDADKEARYHMAKARELRNLHLQLGEVAK